MQGRLNTFQLSMLQWNALHPYNAVHVVRVPGVLEFGRLQSAITGTLERAGLTGLRMDGQAGTYEYCGGPASVEIKRAAPGPGDRSPLPGIGAALPPGFADELERQLNTPFAHTGTLTPFRFFVAADDQSFSLGLVYCHPVADAESIVWLLRDIVDAYRGRGNTASASAVERYPACRDSLLWQNPGVLVRKLASLPAAAGRMRRTCRPHYRDAGDFTNKFTFVSLGPEALSGMLQAAKSLHVTLNDLFLALLMKAVAQVAPDRAQAGRRRDLSLGCIVNTRRDLGLEGGRVFGLFLGSFVVHHEAPAGIGLAELARDIARQTRAIKEKRLYLGAALELTCGRLLVSLFSEQRRKKLYQKHYPLWGGLTNMNLNALWPQPQQAQPVDYFRAVCTGPVTPLVVSLTTIGEVVNLGLTYRPTVFAPPDVERIEAGFRDPIGPLARP
jgi:hypothetical protein